LKIRYTAEARRDLVDALDHGRRTDPAATAHLADRLLLVIERLAAGEFEGPLADLTLERGGILVGSCRGRRDGTGQ
jgi:plasmid stabilization system protein ParE